MRGKILSFCFLLGALLLAGAGCGKASQGIINKTPSDLPELCRQAQSASFPAEFPEEVIYPDSTRLTGMQMGMEEEKYNVSHDGWLGTFCVKEEPDKILKWFKDKYEPLGYTYATMETVHYWTLEDEKSVMLDLVKDLENGYEMYTVDIREYNL